MDITLSAEQKAVFEIMEGSRQHLFITGRAGTGKSVLLRHFRENTEKKSIVVAPTGIAALNVRGQTIHSLFSLAPGFHEKGKLSPNSRLRTLLKRIEVIIIDEISMVRADLMDAIDDRFREAFRNDIPFGGVQVVMFGDLYQLPPVVNKNLLPYFERNYGGFHFFNASAWKQTEFKIYELSQIFRQKEPVFKNILNVVRDGTVEDGQIEQLNERHNVAVPAEGVLTLATTNSLVTNINQQRLNKLEGKMYEYKASITGEMKESTFPTEEVIQLKKDAQVVLLKNDKDKRWVNGTIGYIHDLSDDKISVSVNGIVYDLDTVTWEEIQYTYDPDSHKVEEKVASSFTQYPIRLAWAMTIHKSQGQTYESVALDLTTSTFAPGQMYVALSRCTSLEGLYLKMPVKRKDIIVDQKVKAFMERREAIQVEISDQNEINHDEINVIDSVLVSPQLDHDEIGVEYASTLFDDCNIHHDEICNQVVDDAIEDNGDMLNSEKNCIHHDEIETNIVRPTNSKLEKKGRKKKDKSSTRGRKTKSGEIREPLQLSLDVRTIQTLNAMGVNKSELFEKLLSQYQPFLEIYATVLPETK